jgi:hypothetical protein
VLVAGYGNTYLTAGGGGDMELLVLADDPDGVDDIAEVELLYRGARTGLTIPLDATGFGVFEMPGLDGPLPPGRFLLELAVTDQHGQQSLLWPYLTIPQEPQRMPDRYRPFVDEPELLRDQWLHLYGRTVTRRATSADAPKIVVAGYLYTDVSASGGGSFNLVAYVPPAPHPVQRVTVLYNGRELGLDLRDDGVSGDFGRGDHVYGVEAHFAPGEANPLSGVVLEIVAYDVTGAASDVWPYLSIN